MSTSAFPRKLNIGLGAYILIGLTLAISAWAVVSSLQYRSAKVLTPAQIEHVEAIKKDIQSSLPLDGAIIEFRAGSFAYVKRADHSLQQLTVFFPKLESPMQTVRLNDDSWLYAIVSITRATDSDYAKAREKLLPASARSVHTR